MITLAALFAIAVMAGPQNTIEDEWEESIRTAGRLVREGRYAEAKLMLDLALRHAEAIDPPDQRLAVTLNEMGGLLYDTADFVAAEKLYRRALQTWERLGLANDPGTETPLNNLGILYRRIGQPSKAVPLLTRVLEARCARFGLDHPTVARSLNNLAEARHEQGNVSEAESLLRQALAIHERLPGPPREHKAAVLNNLAFACRQRKALVEAERLYLEANTIWEAALGPRDPALARGMANLASLYLALGRHTEAELLLRRGLNVTQEVLGPDHPQTGDILQLQAELLRKTGEGRKARQLAQRAKEIQGMYRKANLLDHTVDASAFEGSGETRPGGTARRPVTAR